MDPDAALAEMLDIARADQSEFHHGIHRLCELTLGMHEHLSQGGFLPAAWQATVEERNPHSKPAPDNSGIGFGAFPYREEA